MAMIVGVEDVGVAGVEDGMESLQANNDFAMQAPGAPGAIVLDTVSVGMVGGGDDEELFGRRGWGEDGCVVGFEFGGVDLPDMGPMLAGGLQRDMTIRARRASAGEGSSSAMSAAAAASTSRAAFDAKSVAPGSGTGMNVDSDIQAQTVQRPVSAPEIAATTSTASTATNASARGGQNTLSSLAKTSKLTSTPIRSESRPLTTPKAHSIHANTSSMLY